MKQPTFRKLIFSLIFSLISFFTFSQDTIVTKQRDTICCKITKISETELQFELKDQQEIRKLKLPITSVFEYKLNPNFSSAETFNKYRLAFNGGYSYRTSPYQENISSEEKASISKLRKGFHFGTEMMYYPTYRFGLGVKYCYMSTQNAPIDIHTFAAKADFRFSAKNQKHFFHMYGSAGYMGYIESISESGVVRINARAIGLSIGMGYDVLVKRHMAIGVEISYLLGALSSIEITNGYSTATIDLKDNPEGLNRIDVSIGIRFIR